MQPVLIGIAGGSGSGKSTIMRRLAESLAGAPVTFVPMDAYYRDLSALPVDDRDRRNFDHPDAYDLDLLASHLAALRRGEPVAMPVYDFRAHVRTPAPHVVAPGDVVIADGILLFHDARIRDALHLKVFVDADADVRLARRIRRDLAERGRTVEGVLDQYLATVRPMHERFVAPTREHADLVVPHGGHNDAAVELLRQFIERLLRPVPA